MSYGILVPTYYGLENVTLLRSVKPSFTETLTRASSFKTYNISMPTGSDYTNIFFHWDNLVNSDRVQWTSPTNLRVILDVGSATINLYFRGM